MGPSIAQPCFVSVCGCAYALLRSLCGCLQILLGRREGKPRAATDLGRGGGGESQQVLQGWIQSLPVLSSKLPCHHSPWADQYSLPTHSSPKLGWGRTAPPELPDGEEASPHQPHGAQRRGQGRLACWISCPGETAAGRRPNESELRPQVSLPGQEKLISTLPPWLGLRQGAWLPPAALLCQLMPGRDGVKPGYLRASPGYLISGRGVSTRFRT